MLVKTNSPSNQQYSNMCLQSKSQLCNVYLEQYAWLYQSSIVRFFFWWFKNYNAISCNIRHIIFVLLRLRSIRSWTYRGQNGCQTRLGYWHGVIQFHCFWICFLGSFWCFCILALCIVMVIEWFNSIRWMARYVVDLIIRQTIRNVQMYLSNSFFFSFLFFVIIYFLLFASASFISFSQCCNNG